MSHFHSSRAGRTSSDRCSELAPVFRTHSWNYEPLAIFPDGPRRTLPNSSGHLSGDKKSKGTRNGTSSKRSKKKPDKDSEAYTNYWQRALAKREAQRLSPYDIHQTGSLKRRSDASQHMTRLVAYEDDRHAYPTAFDKTKGYKATKQKRNYRQPSIPDWMENPFVTSMQLKSRLKINKAREKYGLEALQLDPLLNEVAGFHNYDQAYILKIGKCSHKGSDDSKLTDRLNFVEYKYDFACENLTRGCESISEAVEVLMSNPRTRTNFVSPFVSRMGMHVGKDITGTWFWTFILCG